MRARAAITVELIDGLSRCTELRNDPPLSLRLTPGGVHLVGSSAGPIGGDDLRLDVRVGAGAELTIRSVAASMVLPGPTGAPSALSLRVTVAEGATLRWRPRPTILVQGCDHRADVQIHLADDAELFWRDEIVLGRHDEPSGSLHQHMLIDVGGRPLLRNDLALGPRWPQSSGPAGVAGAGAVATTVTVGSRMAIPSPVSGSGSPGCERDGVRMAVLPLDHESAAMIVAVADHPGALAGAWARAARCY